MKINLQHLVALVIAIAVGATATFAASGVDLTPSTPIKYFGQPSHGVWCNYLPVPAANRADKNGQFKVQPNTTVVGNVTTNYGESVTPDLSGLPAVGVTTRYGLSGALYVCVKATDAAKPWGAIGFGNPPTAANATIKTPSNPAIFAFYERTTVRMLNVELESDGTSVTLPSFAATKVTAMIGNVPLGDECTNAATGNCVFNAPENTTFYELGQGKYISLTIQWDGVTDPAGAAMGLDLVP